MGNFRHQAHADRGKDDRRTHAHTNLAFNQPESTCESLGINAGYEFTDGIELYSTITYAHRHGEVFENYRLPSVLAGVYPNGFTPTETIEENDYQVTLDMFGRYTDAGSIKTEEVLARCDHACASGSRHDEQRLSHVDLGRENLNNIQGSLSYATGQSRCTHPIAHPGANARF